MSPGLPAPPGLLTVGPPLPPPADCRALKQLYDRGYEVACHTVSHKRLAGEAREFVEREAVEGRRQLAACGVPERDIVGFRAPFLDVDPQLRGVLHHAGFLYDRWGGWEAAVWQPDAGMRLTAVP